MLQAEQVEELITLVASLDRPAVIEAFRKFPATFPLDFTTEFLAGMPLERLRHLFVALCLEQQRMPELNIPTAA
jgi:hypothetical protein